MKCPEIKNLLHEHYKGELTGKEAEKVRIHLDACPECRTELESVRKYYAFLRSDKKLRVPKDFLARVHERIGAATVRKPLTEKVREFLEPFFRPIRARWVLGFAGTAAAIVVAFVLFKPAYHTPGKMAMESELEDAESLDPDTVDALGTGKMSDRRVTRSMKLKTGEKQSGILKDEPKPEKEQEEADRKTAAKSSAGPGYLAEESEPLMVVTLKEKKRASPAKDYYPADIDDGIGDIAAGGTAEGKGDLASLSADESEAAEAPAPGPEREMGRVKKTAPASKTESAVSYKVLSEGTKDKTGAQTNLVLLAGMTDEFSLPRIKKAILDNKGKILGEKKAGATNRIILKIPRDNFAALMTELKGFGEVDRPADASKARMAEENLYFELDVIEAE